MKSSYLNTGALVALMLCAMPMASADSKIRTRYSIEGRATESIVYAQGERQRLESNDTIIIQQGDTQKMIRIDPLSKTYVVMPHSAAASDAPRQGGVIEMRTMITDTKERKQILGYEARHLKVEMRRHSKPGACTAIDDRLEIDGWYIDFQMPAAVSDDVVTCHDEIHEQSGVDTKLGFPVDYTMKSWDKPNTTPAATRVEVLDLSVAALDPSLFEIPADYQDAATTSVTVHATPKKNGVTRVAVAAPSDKTSKAGFKPGDNRRLAALLSRVGIDAIAIESDEQAKKFEADYVLQTQVVELKTLGGPAAQVIAKAGRFGGMIKTMSRMSTMGALANGAMSLLAGSVEAQLEYKLVPAEAGQPIAGSVKGNTGNTLSLQNVLTVAPTAMNAGMTAMAGSPALIFSSNPSLFSALNSGPDSTASAEGKAVQAALENEAKAIADALKK